ncbi:MAG: type II toxin-antitoxin system Phd/YefM family antitoxin [Anaerolineae bacterium]
MRTAGVRELKENTSELIRLVREEKEEVEITYRGKVVARLVPAEDPAERERRSDEAWARLMRIKESTPTAEAAARDGLIWRDLERLAEEVSAVWPAGVSAVDAVREQRREL